jgi:DNA-binding CsgD family transcriptional regulator
MKTSLKPLFEAINQVQHEEELRSQIVPKLGEYFGAKRSGVLFFDKQPPADSMMRQALRSGLSIDNNPVVRYLVEHHAPVHEAMLTSPKVWTMICPRPDHWHVMAGPIVSHGRLVGVLGCTREQSMPAFDAKDLADMSGVCLHLSVWAATVRWQQQPFKTAALAAQTEHSRIGRCLTSRELQIAELVALGRTNAAIGSELWITENSVKQALKRIFRKLAVSSRAEMVAQVYTQPMNRI